MATDVKRIEKEFLMKVLYDEQIPMILLKDRTEYILILDQPAKNGMVFRPEMPISKLKPKTEMKLLFDYRGQKINFSVEIDYIKESLIYCEIPNVFHKNLDRSFSRVEAPPDMNVKFAFRGERYNLSFPKLLEFESENVSDLLKNVNPKDISGLIDQMADWIKKYANGYKMTTFKDSKPETTEERIISETGKVLFLPSTLGYFPQSDPYPKKRIITEDMFKRYMESTGVSFSFLNDACNRYIKGKFEEGFFSDAWVPILFQEYVVGYIHLWINKEGKLPFDFGVIDHMLEFSKMLAFSLKMNGYFESGKLPNDLFDGKIIDISASGLLFAYPSNLASHLLVDSELKVVIISPKRKVLAVAKIVRRFKDGVLSYFGCRFLDMAPEDLRFLFEFIYGKPFTDADAMFLSGQV
jgi:hypothetical protein